MGVEGVSLDWGGEGLSGGGFDCLDATHTLKAQPLI
jgi:hypothetical protein